LEKLRIKSIQKNLNTSFIGKKIIYFKELDSTNTFAIKFIRDTKNSKAINMFDGTVIVAETQTKGKGRFDRMWFSPPGGLWFSIILQPKIELNDLSKITLLSAAVLVEILEYDYLSSEHSKDLHIKWPNDIYYKDRKLAGILAESEKINERLYLIVGIGLNANCNIANNLGKNTKAISLKKILGMQIDRNFLLSKILTAFEKNYTYFTGTEDFKSIFNKIERFIIF
jgi:BirA family biotin operon repressor/biotin-[acetyl-CoA-carboxylase] ligase